GHAGSPAGRITGCRPGGEHRVAQPGRAGAGGGGSHPPGGGQAAQPLRAFCGLRPRVLQGEVSPCEPLWPAFQLVPRLPNPIEHTRPRGIHAPTRSVGIIQTMLLALANFGLERMARKNSGGYAGMALLSALRAQNQKPKTKNQKPKTKNQKPKTKNQKPKTKNQKTKEKTLPAAGRKNLFGLLRFFPAHPGQPADKKIR